MDLSVIEISKQIHKVRGLRVMLDSDLARLFQTDTRTLNQSVRRNICRFPEDFMFRLNKGEFTTLMSQIVTSKKEYRGGRQKLPNAFTEAGVVMLACLFNSKIADKTSVAAVRAFAQIRQHNEDNAVVSKVEEIEARLDAKLDRLLNLIPQKQLQIAPPPTSLRYESDATLKAEALMKAVSEYFRVSVSSLKSSTRLSSVVLPRQICVYLIREGTGKSFKEIGRFMGRDHTTVLHSHSKIQAALAVDKEIRTAVETLRKMVH